MIDDEKKPWEDNPTGPAPKSKPFMLSIDLFAVGRWFKRWRDERRDKKSDKRYLRDGPHE
jgi:hypothetical protein